VAEAINPRLLINDPNDYRAIGFRNWWDNRANDDYDLETLIENIHLARYDQLTRSSPNRVFYRMLHLYDIEQRVQKAKAYWATFLFEFIYLSYLIWFPFWPWFKRKPLWQCAQRLVWLPVLFMLPAYLGYAIFSFTSVGPSGGILYPWLLIFLPRPWISLTLDQIILQRVPQLLEPLSQGTGLPLAITGFGMWGPTTIILFGLCLGAASLLLFFLVRFWQNPKS